VKFKASGASAKIDIVRLPWEHLQKSMAARLAEEFWPRSRIDSAGTQVQVGQPPARAAISEMAWRVMT
jgi:hypothetical protein